MKKTTRKGPFWGRNHTEETKKKIALALKGRKLSKETRKKISIKSQKLALNPEWIKHNSDSKKGEKCYLWKGGIGKKHYGSSWTSIIRKQIRKRDNFRCQKCGRKEKKIDIPVHHIDYNKENCNYDNLITLCIRCHGKTNQNRNIWKWWFRWIILSKYGI